MTMWDTVVVESDWRKADIRTRNTNGYREIGSND
jgi:hypothetical protein